MKLLFLLLISGAAFGQTDSIAQITLTGHGWVSQPFGNNYNDNYYNITDDKWVIRDTMMVIKELYKQLQYRNTVEEWYEQRIDEMYNKQWHKVHELERHRPKNNLNP